MSSAVSGKNGAVIVGSDKTECDNFTITQTVDQLVADSFDTGGWGDGVDGFARWSGTFHAINYHASLTGARGVATFQVDPTPAANAPQFAGTISIGEVATEVGAPDIVGHTYNFTGRGTLTVTVA